MGSSATVESVVAKVVQSSSFTVATKGIPYVLFYSSNLTQRSQTYGNSTANLPDALELGFATYGPHTACNEGGPWQDWIDVQVPIQNGSYAVGIESVHSVGGPK